MKKQSNNFRLELLEQIFYVVNKYIMNISQSKKPRKLSPNLLRIMEDITFLTQLYAGGYTENGNKEKDLGVVSTDQLVLILHNKKIKRNI